MSLIQRIAGVTITAPSLKVYREALFNSGSLYAFDTLDAYSANGLTDLADAAALADARTLKNLIRGGADATLRLSTAAGAASLSKLAGGVRRTGYNAAIDLGVGYGMQTSQRGFLATCWWKPDASASATEYGIIGYTGTTFPNLQHLLSFKPSTNQLKGQVGGIGPALVIDQTLQQVGLAYYLMNGVPYLDIFRNGARVGGTSANSLPTVIPTPEAVGSEGFGFYGFNVANPKINSQFGQDGQTFYRAYKEDLTISAASTGRTPAAQALAQVQAEWAANRQRFGL